MAIPSDPNTSVRVAEKLAKYKDQEIEITKMWGLKTITVPLVIGALGVVKKGIEKHIDRIPGKTKITEFQKIPLLGSSQIFRKVLLIKWRPWLHIRAPDPGLDPALMVNMIQESRRIRDNNNNNNNSLIDHHSHTHISTTATLDTINHNIRTHKSGFVKKWEHLWVILRYACSELLS